MMGIKGHNAIPVNFPVKAEPKQRGQRVKPPVKRIEIREYLVRVRISPPALLVFPCRWTSLLSSNSRLFVS